MTSDASTPQVSNALEGRIEKAAVLTIAVLMVIYISTYVFSVATIDTGRDWAQALQIASGTAFTATGPALKVDVFHFGPVWFYLLGGLFYLTHSIALTSLVVGVLAALKFPLAYLCGKSLLDRRLGLLWALMLALPGWQTMTQVHITHINLVETLCLLMIYLLIRFAREGEGKWLMMLGLVFGLALHAHPSTAPLGLLAIFVYLYEWKRSGNIHGVAVLVAAILFLLPFLPYLVSQTLDGWPEWQHAAGYIQSETGFGNLLKLPQLLLSAVVYAPKSFFLSVLAASDYGGLWLIGVYALYLLGALGLVWALVTGVHRMLILVGLAALLLVGAGVLYLRPQTPYYMTYVLYPLIALVLALGLYGWDRRSGGKLLVGCGMAVLLLSSALSAGLVRVHTSGEGGFPSGLFMNVAAGKFGRLGRDLRFPAVSQDRLGEYLCTFGSDVAVHGDLAFIVDASFSAGSRLQCGEHARVSIAGGAGGQETIHVAGFPRRVWRVLGWAPSTWIGPFGITESLQPVAPSVGIPLPQADVYPPRAFQKGPGKRQRWRFVLHDAQVLTITNPFPWYLPIEDVRVMVEGRLVRPLAQTRASRLYPLVDCGAAEQCRIEVELRTARREWVDIFALSKHPQQKATAARSAPRPRQ